MLLLAMAVACRSRPAERQAVQPESCLDGELSRRGLNPFGDPPDTVYAGGTPLFDERSGKTADRTAYVLSRHPEIARACDAGD
jgi:hypothetical protein